MILDIPQGGEQEIHWQKHFKYRPKVKNRPRCVSSNLINWSVKDKIRRNTGSKMGLLQGRLVDLCPTTKYTIRFPLLRSGPVGEQWRPRWSHGSLSWRQRGAPEPQMSNNPQGVETWASRCLWWTVAGYSEVIRSYKSSGQPSPSLSSPPLLRTPSCGAAATQLRQPANKSSYTPLPHRSDERASRGKIKILQNNAPTLLGNRSHPAASC